MKAVDLVKFVCKQDQITAAKQVKPERKHLVLTEQFYNDLYTDMTSRSHFEVDPKYIKIVKGWETPLKIEELEKKVKDGYWVYTFFFSVDYHEFQWHPNRKKALKAFNALRNDMFCGAKLLLYVDDMGILNVEV